MDIKIDYMLLYYFEDSEKHKNINKNFVLQMRDKIAILNLDFSFIIILIVMNVNEIKDSNDDPFADDLLRSNGKMTKPRKLSQEEYKEKLVKMMDSTREISPQKKEILDTNTPPMSFYNFIIGLLNS